MEQKIIEYILQVLAAGVGILGFSVVLHVPRRQWLFCAVNGAVSWLIYLLTKEMGAGTVMASISSSFVVTIVSRLLSAVRREPSTTFLITAIFPLVPGAGIYYTAYYLIMDNFAAAGAKGLETFEVAGGIVLGIIFGFAVPKAIFDRFALEEKQGR